MYCLKNNQLIEIEEIVTPNQVATVENPICEVFGNLYGDIVYYETIPVMTEIEGKLLEVHFDTETKQLVLIYKDIPLSQDEYIMKLENELLILQEGLL